MARPISLAIQAAYEARRGRRLGEPGGGSGIVNRIATRPSGSFKPLSIDLDLTDRCANFLNKLWYLKRTWRHGRCWVTGVGHASQE